jgi:4-amino-4-deoxy-L-arabinose transferase-like glycosyltransferase
MRRSVFLLTLALIAVFGAFLVWRATPEGLGLSDDSIAYIAGARSLLAGDGYREPWLESNQPVTHFPPAFSGVLALIGLAGINPINAAHVLNALLFGMNAALLGVLGWRMTRSQVAGIILALLFVLNDSLLRVHAVAMSEPLFLFFSLLAFLSFAIHFEKEKPAWLAVTGLLTSLAYLVRYSGLALLATFVVAILLLKEDWRKRITGVLIFLAGCIPLMAAWSIRNRLAAGNTTNRLLIWHPVTGDTLNQGLRTFSEFMVPVEEWRRLLFKTPGIFVSVIAVILLAILVWILVNGLRRFFKPASPMPEIIGLTSGLYVFGYLASVLFSISLFDASTPLKLRILAPVYLPLLLFLVGAGTWLWNRRPYAWRAMVLGVAALVFGMSITGQARTVQELSRGGQGYASFKWYDSKIMAYLRTLPGDVAIYTNEPGAVYLYTGRSCRVLPERVDPVTGLMWDNFEAGVALLQQDVLSGSAVLVVFDTDPNDARTDYEQMSAGLVPVLKSGGDVIYQAPPPQELK